MAQLLGNAGYSIAADPEKAGVLIVNTCGFIGPAKDESLQVLSDLAAQKTGDQVLIAAGCLTQRYGVEVAEQVPGIDGIIGTRRWMDIVEVVQQLRQGQHPQPIYHLPNEPKTVVDEQAVQRVAIQGASAYIKIADGCRRPCAFCAIPLIKGTAVSRPIDSILDEASMLQDMGVKEIILIAQDTTDYGHDLGVKDGLAELLEELVVRLDIDQAKRDSAQEGVNWIRVMYAYPGYVTDRMIDVIATHSKIVPYLDMPLQHADPGVLRRMRRPANINWVHRTLAKMRQSIENLAIRTTFIVGYPGETEKEFQNLLDFINEIRFDRVGVFQFSFETGTYSESLGDPIPAEVKQERWEEVMELQQGISLQKNQAFVGKELDVLIEGQGDGLSIGRTYRDAPEIDGLTIVEGEIPLGEMVPVRITGAMTYDLSGILAVEGSPLSFVDIDPT